MSNLKFHFCKEAYLNNHPVHVNFQNQKYLLIFSNTFDYIKQVENKDIWLVGRSKISFVTRANAFSLYFNTKGKLSDIIQEQDKILIQDMDVFGNLTNEDLVRDCQIVDNAIKELLPILTNK